MKEFLRELNDCAASMFTINRQGVAILIFLPIIYTLLFGGLFYKNSLTNIPVIICNLDDGSAGRSLVEDFMNTPELKVISVEGDALDDENYTDFFLATLILHGGQIATIFVLEPSLAIRKNIAAKIFSETPHVVWEQKFFSTRCLNRRLWQFASRLE